MTATTRRILSTGSIWLIDDDLKRYLRLPKQEGPRTDGFGRPRPEWGNQPGALKDGDWHPYEHWFYVWTDDRQEAVQLVIEYSAANCTAKPKGLPCQNKHYIRTGVIVDANNQEIIPEDREITGTAAEHELAYTLAHYSQSELPNRPDE